MPSGQASSRSFTVANFKLPSPSFSEVASVRAEAVGIAISKDTVKAFLERLVMQNGEFAKLADFCSVFDTERENQFSGNTLLS
ncbi:hypothetical protein KIN20_023096 [Parelaphostrongylus tenuis]|uniref:Uncharacterized protein n=1 Tax=Parelaphostrongylus tenuis TaxID=148309 RepID=A0AAD5QSR1_PARTN|nr:hypothetical protein KIN20_023096 [Parelaphostrongylus tenuis]